MEEEAGKEKVEKENKQERGGMGLTIARGRKEIKIREGD